MLLLPNDHWSGAGEAEATTTVPAAVLRRWRLLLNFGELELVLVVVRRGLDAHGGQSLRNSRWTISGGFHSLEFFWGISP